jgi:hypothetical protein
MSQDGMHYLPGSHADETSPDLRELAAAISQNTEMINTMNVQIQQLIEDNQRRDDDIIKSQQEQLNSMTKQLAQTQAELALVRGKLDIVKTCSSTMQAILDPQTSRNVRQKVNPTQPSLGAHQANPVQQENDPPQHQYGDKKPRISCKGKRISQLLVDFYNENLLSGDNWKSVRVPPHHPEANLIKKSLELCQYVMSEEELFAFRAGTFTDEEALRTAADEIERRAFRKMWEFEGFDDIDRKEAENNNGGRGQQPTYGAVGSRVREYKKYLAKLSGNQYSDKEPLRERPEEEEGASPLSMDRYA